MSYFQEEFVRRNICTMEEKLMNRGTNTLMKDYERGNLSESEFQYIMETADSASCGDEDSMKEYMDKMCELIAVRDPDYVDKQTELRLGYVQIAQEEKSQSVLVTDDALFEFKKAMARAGMRMIGIKPVLESIDRENPVMAFRLYQLIFEEMKVPPTILLTKKHWMAALKYAITLRFLVEDLEDVQVPEDREELEFIYIHAFVIAVVLAHTESGVRKEIKSDVKAEERQPSKTLQKENASLKERNADLKKKNKELQQRLRKEVTNAVVPLEQKLSQKDAEIERLQAELAAYKSIQQAEEETEEILECVEQLTDLPESGVAFVGGHCNLQSKLKQRYPLWKFYTTDTPTANIGRPDVVFLYSDHINHILFNRVSAKYKDRMLYCHGTNIEKLSENMQRNYTAYRLKMAPSTKQKN